MRSGIRNRWAKCVGIVSVGAMIMIQAGWMGLAGANPASTTAGKVNAARHVLAKYTTQYLEPYYQEMKAEWQAKGVQDTKGVHLAIPGGSFSAASGTKGMQIAKQAGKSVLRWKQENTWVEYRVNVPQTGYYQMSLTYLPLKGMRNAIVRALQIDGKYPFVEARRFEFTRIWREDRVTPLQDVNGDDVPQRQVEIFHERTQPFEDPNGLQAEPMRFYMTKGTHHIRLIAMREPVELRTLHIDSPAQIPSYAEYKSSLDRQGWTPVTAVKVEVPGERAMEKGDLSIRPLVEMDPTSTPFEPGHKRLNVNGGYAWRMPGQWVTWKFDVPKKGLYAITLKGGQWFVEGATVQRSLYIDGHTPFKEANSLSFNYLRQLQNFSLGGNNPYLFALTPGEHTLTLRIQFPSYGDTISDILSITRAMSNIIQDIVMVTGPNPARDQEWKLTERIPSLVGRLSAVGRILDEDIKSIRQIGGTSSSQTAVPLMIRDQMADMAVHPDSIPDRLTSLSDSLSSLGNWMLNLQQQGLTLDSLVIHSPDTKFSRGAANPWEWIVSNVSLFWSSFSKDYRHVASVKGSETQKVNTTLNVWIGRGREWAQALKRLADEDFTPRTGIQIQMNVLPAGTASNTLLMSITSGKAPDVAMGMTADLPVDLAIRGGVVDLSRMPGYAEVSKRFRSGALGPFQWGKGTYALPETQNFNMLFYRADILGRLNIKPPQTWTDVESLIPQLQHNKLEFFYPPADATAASFSPFLFQNGGEYYDKAGNISKLDTPQAIQAFKLWTGLYTNYKVQKQADFFTRFRTGEMPIGVASYQMYTLLTAAAPELNGWWEMAPIPGVRQADGTINRSAGGLGETVIITKQSKKTQAAWEFLKWWTSDEVQQRYGSDLESLIGREARWNTANVHALQGLPWPKKDIDVVMQQWQWFKERPVVLGGYFSGRHIYNAWNSVVLNGALPLEALQNAVREIDREIIRKQVEFGFRSAKDLGLTAKQLLGGSK